MQRLAVVQPDTATGLAVNQDEEVLRRRILLPIPAALGLELHPQQRVELRGSKRQQRELLPVRGSVEAIEEVVVRACNRTKRERQSAQFRDG